MENNYTHINQKLYYSTVLVVISLMLLGLFVDNPLLEHPGPGFFTHGALVCLFSMCLIIYPKYKSHFIRILIIVIGSSYFYSIFFLYPNTWSNFIFLCFIPAISILFFDSRLFHYTLLTNTFIIIGLLSYIAVVDSPHFYPYIREDLIGNIINFLGSQAILYFIFYISYGRLQKQKLYYEQIKQSERLKTTGQLAAAVAHEIRNPLTVVKGFLQIYEKENKYNEESNRHYSLMIDELNTAEQVISQFLSIAKPDKDTKPELVNVKTVLQSVTDLLNSYGLLRDNKIILRMDEDCYIAANTIEFKQLLINIIKNAIEASRVGDSVVITAESKKSLVEIKVIDQGQGMSKEEIDSLGTPFYSLKSKGTGLGMMICFNIATKYKGSISFSSEKGVGTTVTIRFPSTNVR
ncbi:two-component system sporulation sensor kinase B [Bacillus mesophilus]|uniref:histidine kinase n=1 Tax=Bacillus mesophilus TaxID=1808955 RepID=A0A6M0QAH5_9BACI|nr:HAMP domain-containing sensor histidine kinase [Bacillus mesophilus]MBM7662558.1 two-component system sporulation sensor kinase B [Bacillus mesophilus]NEY73374.1 HAMP domain-containing histidine kinase [Bacillus mesophilus]